jgi:hypothetical protein
MHAAYFISNDDREELDGVRLLEIHCLNFISSKNPTASLDSGEDPETGKKGIPIIVIGTGLIGVLADFCDLQNHRADAEASGGSQNLLAQSLDKEIFRKRAGGKDHAGLPGENFDPGFQKQTHLFSRLGVSVSDQTPTLPKKPNSDRLFGFPTLNASADGENGSLQNPFLNILS